MLLRVCLFTDLRQGSDSKTHTDFQAHALSLNLRAERENIMKKALKTILGAALAVYVLALVYILFLRGRGNVYDQAQPLSEYAKYAVNLIPFETINGFWRALRENRINTDIALFNIFGNIALFVPFGFLIPCLEKKLRALWKCAAVSFVVILAVETLQLIFKVGSFDVDDIILNLIGVIIGYAVYKIAAAIYKKTSKSLKKSKM